MGASPATGWLVGWAVYRWPRLERLVQGRLVRINGLQELAWKGPAPAGGNPGPRTAA
jgi:hypothetical protein